MESRLLTVANTAALLRVSPYPQNLTNEAERSGGPSTPVQPCVSYKAGRYLKCGGHDGDWTRNLPVNSRALSPS